MKKHEPLDVEQEILSPDKRAWVSTDARPGLTKFSGIFNVLTSTQNKVGTYDIASSYLLSDKGLFDGEPGRVVNELERRWPDFFNDFPCRGPLTNKIKRAFIGEFCRTYIGLGKRRFGKPGLRKSDMTVIS